MPEQRPDLEWHFFDSSNVEAAAWEAIFSPTEYELDEQGGARATEYEASDKGTLHVIYNPEKGGGRRQYKYAEVPYSVFEGLLAAGSRGSTPGSSKGKYLN